MRLGWVLCLCLVSVLHAVPFTPFPELRRKVVLKAARSPYLMDRHAVLGAQDTLIIEPGVTIYMKGYVRLMLRGVVDIRGTQKRPVQMLSLDSADSWVGVHFSTAERAFSVQHLVIRNAFRNTVSASRGYMASTLFINNYYGLWVDASPHLQLGSCGFSRNRYALSVGSGSVQLNDSRISDNVFGVYLEPGAHVEGAREQVSGNAEADWRDESAEMTARKDKVSRSLWHRVEAGF